MAKNFSEEDIKQLKNNLRKACEYSWRTNGYKMTSIASLTKEVGISTGSFYRLYETKEELFFEVFTMIENRLKEEWNKIIESNQGIDGFKEALKWLFREYTKYPRMYDFNNPDYILFLNKLSKENIKYLKENNENFFSDALDNSGLSLKISKEKAYRVFSTLLFTATMEKDFGYDKYEVFEFLLDNSINKIFNIN
ncbi:MAG TPA: TetR/AcrR family transcriptional regulator [Clostridium sp.]|nr:TetR/AcrR family transcriptional regulator [Clostridium sp.]